MRLLVTGDRVWNDPDMIFMTIAKRQHRIQEVCQGGAAGADIMAFGACRDMHIICKTFPAQWKLYGRAAGPIRNQQMLDEFKPTQVFAFHDNLEASKGTKDMVRRAKKAGIPVRLFSHSHPEGQDL